jgi:hypothetical protein
MSSMSLKDTLKVYKLHYNREKEATPWRRKKSRTIYARENYVPFKESNSSNLE